MFQLYGKNYYIWLNLPKFDPEYLNRRIHYDLRKKKSNPGSTSGNPEHYWQQNSGIEKKNKPLPGTVLFKK